MTSLAQGTALLRSPGRVTGQLRTGGGECGLLPHQTVANCACEATMRTKFALYGGVLRFAVSSHYPQRSLQYVDHTGIPHFENDLLNAWVSDMVRECDSQKQTSNA